MSRIANTRNLLLPAAFAVFLGWVSLPVAAAEPQIDLGFDAPDRVTGSPGEVKTFEAYLTISITENLEPIGPDRFALSVTATGAKITGITMDGIHVAALLCLNKELCTPYDLDLKETGDTGFKLTDLTSKDDRKGASAICVLSITSQYKALQPLGTQRVAKITLESQIPVENQCMDITLSHEDGFRGQINGTVPPYYINDVDMYFPSTGQRASFDLAGRYGHLLTAHDATVHLCQEAPSNQLPGDINQDGGLDISDAVDTLGFFFLGSPLKLPCGDGSATDLANVKLLDWQPDGQIDISDAVAMLTFLFIGGHPHALVPEADAKGCVKIVGCTDSCGK